MHGKITMYKHRQLHSMAKVTLLTYFTLTIDKFFIIMFQTFFKFHFFDVSNFKKNFTNVFCIYGTSNSQSQTSNIGCSTQGNELLQ